MLTNPSIPQRAISYFWDKVSKTDTCWLWIASVNHAGYGMFGWKKDNRTVHISAHRCSWILHNGPIHDDLHVLHTCDVRNCVNPDHLFLGTNLDNKRDMVEKGRQAKGERQASAKLTQQQVLEIRSLSEAGESYHRIASYFGVSRVQISNIVHRRAWGWLDG